jgi:hypothetical protein
MIAQSFNGGITEYNTLLNPVIPTNTLQYIQNNIAMTNSKLQNSGTEVMNTINNIYNSNYGEKQMSRINNTLYHMRAEVRDDIIYRVTPENITRATELIKPYIMSNKELYGRYREQTCSGFDNSFYDQGKLTGIYFNPPFIQMNNGMESEDGMVIYSGDLPPQISYEEQEILRSNDEVVQKFMDDGIDPSSDDLSRF